MFTIWCAPRSSSTALFLSLSNIKGIHTLFEPFDMNFYYSKERVSNRYFPKGKIDPKWHNYTGKKIYQELFRRTSKGLTLIKECVFQARNYLSPALLKKIRYNILIIRDPRLTLSSLLKYKPDFTAIEAGYIDLKKAYNYLKKNKQSYLIIDASDLRSKPAYYLQKICKYIHIPFDKELLKFSKAKSVGFSDQSDMYQRVLSSKQIQPPVEKLPSLNIFQPYQRVILERAMKVYQMLYKERIV